MRNPFIYVTDNYSDFAGDQGVHLKDYFKKVFYLNYNKYQKIIKEVVPAELVNQQFKLYQESLDKAGKQLHRNE